MNKDRQKQISENKFGKYLLYAFGEIILIVVGILIALQIDNWNENRKNDNLKESYIENLKVDLNEDLENLENLDRINTHCETEGFYLDAYLQDNLPDMDTVRLSNAIILTQFIPNTTIVSSTYNDIMNSNNIVLFEDDQLKKLLDSYYIQDEWEQRFNEIILNTAWNNYKDEMLKFHSAVLYRDFYASEIATLKAYKPVYNVQWDEMKQDEYLKTQVGMIGAYRLVIRRNLEKKIDQARSILAYLEK